MKDILDFTKGKPEQVFMLASILPPDQRRMDFPEGSDHMVNLRSVYAEITPGTHDDGTKCFGVNIVLENRPDTPYQSYFLNREMLSYFRELINNMEELMNLYKPSLVLQE